MHKWLFWVVSFSFLPVLPVVAAPATALPSLQAPAESAPTNDDASSGYQQLKAVQTYTQDELLDLINKNKHLERVRADDCQLVQDIEIRAEKVKSPAYEFLWGDMLAWGVCVKKNAKLGMHYMWAAANQGLPAALEQLGRYYHKGQFVLPNQERAIQLLRESASLGFIRARMEYVELLAAGYGSPYDYEQAYQWLQNSIFEDPENHQRSQLLLASLALKMTPSAIKRAKATRPDY